MTNHPKTSGLAIAALILGVLGFVSAGLLGIVGIIVAIVAMTSIAQSEGKLTGNGLAIGGLVTGLISLLSGCLLIGLLLPALGQARQSAMSAIERSSVQQMYTGLSSYAAEHDGRLPSGETWRDELTAEWGGEMFVSPRTSDQRPAFAMNAAFGGTLLATILDPDVTVLVFECDPGAAPAGGRELLPAQSRYFDGYIIGFADGAVRLVPPEEIDTLRWDAGP